ncbi:MAG: rod shape determining protein RodA [Gaiellales bacterium]|jgi:rod shape determining protein RodA|nr:rod shape determining protein RodA [Gaiellales bacterium]MDX6591188.1 rod shape determining protein RodA [Gaiellales bacterium]
MRYYLRHLDHLMLATTLAITSFGLWVIHNATRDDVPGNPTYYYDRQFAYAVVGVIGMLIVAAIPPRLMRRVHPLLYLFVLGTLAVVLVIGVSVRGGTRWINLGLFQFQPSELGKLLLIVGLAALLASRRGVWSTNRLTLVGLGYMTLPALLVFAEPDFGTSLVYASVTLGILFVLGAPWRHFAWLGLAGVVALALIFSILPGMGIPVLKQYQQDRLTSFLHPDRIDPQGDGYHLSQSVIAIGHGGVSGRGIEGATQTRLNYLPEHATDFIFSVVGEERGFIGASWLLALYALLIWRGLRVITTSRSTFGSLVAAGIVSMLMFQIFINIGMTIGIAPITGIPLPFMSFGGTHMITNLLAIGVLQAIHVHANQAEEQQYAYA